MAEEILRKVEVKTHVQALYLRTSKYVLYSTARARNLFTRNTTWLLNLSDCLRFSLARFSCLLCWFVLFALLALVVL